MALTSICIGLILTGIGAVAQTPATTAQDFNNRGNQLSEQGDYPGSQRLYGEAVAIWRSLGPEFEGHLAGALLNLGVVLSADRQRHEAAKAYEEALALHRRSLGSKHHRTIT